MPPHLTNHLYWNVVQLLQLVARSRRVNGTAIGGNTGIRGTNRDIAFILALIGQTGQIGKTGKQERETMRKDQQDSPIIDWPSHFSCIALCSSLDMVPVWRYAPRQVIGNIAARLDRFLVHSVFLLENMQVSSFILSSEVPDHKPISLLFQEDKNQGPIPDLIHCGYKIQQHQRNHIILRMRSLRRSIVLLSHMVIDVAIALLL